MLIRRTRLPVAVVILLLLGLSCQKTPLPPLQTFQFETVTLDTNGQVINRRTLQAKSYTENLDGGVQLEMVLIPAGKFTMGSPATEKEREDVEGPQHQVSIRQFYLSKFQVTQAQWRAVASLPKVRIDLKPEPVRIRTPDEQPFKADNNPVVDVNWDEAVEFCARLSQATGHEYRLPSEAEWEYACRAGTTTPFSFGEMITTDFVNYNGEDLQEPLKGIGNRGLIAVGSFGLANGFGLYDMPGNVMEWCGDWEGAYKEAPADGSVREGESTDRRRVLRGCSWISYRADCRSAWRGGLWREYGYNWIGFRVAVS